MFDKAKLIAEITDALNSKAPGRFRVAEDAIKTIEYFELIAENRTEQAPRPEQTPIIPPPACKVCNVVPLAAYKSGEDWFCEEHVPLGPSTVGISARLPSSFRIGRGTAYERMLAWWEGEEEKKESPGEAPVAHPPGD